MPFRKYRKRVEYLEYAIPREFRKKILILDGDVVGTIEYAPAEVCGFPIMGDNIIVMNCIWVLRRAKGHNLGKRLLADMMKSEKKAAGFATVALEDHWSGWMKTDQMQRLGFESVRSVNVVHKTKHRGECFKIHLMWLPTTVNSKPPTWNERKLLEGVDFCRAHPLYHPQTLNLKEILENAS